MENLQHCSVTVRCKEVARPPTYTIIYIYSCRRTLSTLQSAFQQLLLCMGKNQKIHAKATKGLNSSATAGLSLKPRAQQTGLNKLKCLFHSSDVCMCLHTRSHSNTYTPSELCVWHFMSLLWLTSTLTLQPLWPLLPLPLACYSCYCSLPLKNFLFSLLIFHTNTTKDFFIVMTP